MSLGTPLVYEYSNPCMSTVLRQSLLMIKREICVRRGGRIAESGREGGERARERERERERERDEMR